MPNADARKVDHALHTESLVKMPRGHLVWRPNGVLFGPVGIVTSPCDQGEPTAS
jgi:hypothetical protein